MIARDVHTSPLVIVDETDTHVADREALLDRAFGPQRHEKTCERLREGRLAAAGLSLVALRDTALVGTIRLWHVTLGPDRPALLLGPVAVDADLRAEGIGSRLIREALARAAEQAHAAVILVGDEPYYRRFGFSAEPMARLWLPGPVERERFLGLALKPGALSGAAGLVSPTGARILSRMPELFSFDRAA